MNDLEAEFQTTQEGRGMEDDIYTWYCTDCGQECTPVEETFDYAGTHCTHGKSGTHHTGHYVSDCCGAEFSDEPQYDNSTFANHDGTFAEND